MVYICVAALLLRIYFDKENEIMNCPIDDIE
jgi:hypothetical protein